MRECMGGSFCHTHRVQVQLPNIQGVWSQKPYIDLFLEPETSNTRYLDPLGYVATIGRQPAYGLTKYLHLPTHPQ